MAEPAMTASELTPDALAAIEKIKKLLNLAANKGATPEEAANAAARAQELLAKHNLDAATVGKTSPESGKREEAKVDGGFYAHQRSLWDAVARLNFCMYFTQTYFAKGTLYQYNKGLPPVHGVNVRKRRHAVIGRIVNTRATVALATYLEGAVERLTKERLKEQEKHHFSGWAMSYRAGIVATVIDKLEEKRAIVLDAEEKRERDIARAAAAGASSATALSIAAFSKSEEEANLDFVHGEGFSARRAAWRAQAAKERADEEAAYAKWAAEHPEELRKQEEEEQKREERNAKRRRGRSYYGAERDRTDWGAYKAGREAGERIGLDPQVDRGATTKIGRG